jgi:hypothetical protein
MAEDEPPLDNSSIPLSENVSEQGNTIIGTDTTNNNSEIENMEVHHHSHPAGAGHKKKWSAYLLEFLMLFLAVFLGFLAENLREKTVEHHREKEYIESLVEDLKSDTLQSNEILIKLNNKSIGVDSVIAALSSSEIMENSNDAYRLWSKNMGFADFISNDRTIQQLKNSGGLRLIRNKVVSDGIMKYDQVLKDFYGQAAVMNGVLGDQHIYSQLFDFINLDRNTNIPVPLAEQGRKLLNEAYANRKVWQYALTGLISRLQVVNEEGKAFLLIIQKEYHLH